MSVGIAPLILVYPWCCDNLNRCAEGEVEFDMPKYSAVTFGVQPVAKDGRVSGYVVAGFFTKKQLETLRELVDSSEYKRTKKWRGEYQEMAQAIVNAVTDAL
jgi:hypothetical protein